VIYKFKSKASGDVIMLAAHGERTLRLLGREPAPKGIIEVPALPAAIAALEAAIAAAEAAASGASGASGAPGSAGAARAPEGEPPLEPGETPVTLRQRLWPMIELLRRSAAAGVPVVWGV